VLAKLLGYLEYDCKPAGSVKNAKSYLFCFWEIWLQACVVCDCENCWFIYVPAKKRKTEPVCDCSYLACVIATSSYVWLQKRKRNLTLSVWLKSYLVIWNMIASLGSLWLQKTAGSFFVIAKNPILYA
jgi:hypothetical protein